MKSGENPLTPLRRVLPAFFILDDIAIVQENPIVSSNDLRAIFTTDYWGHGRDSGLYRPLTILSFALNRVLLGPGAAGHSRADRHSVRPLFRFVKLPRLITRSVTDKPEEWPEGRKPGN